MFGRIVLILYICNINNSKMENTLNYELKIVPHINKYIKKHKVTGVIERENWFQFKYRVTGVTFKDNDYSWNKAINVNLEVSDKYWILKPNSSSHGWSYSKHYMWSARRRNQYIRTYIREEVKPIIELFSVNCNINIGTIKIVQK